MIDLVITFAPAHHVVAIDLWEGALPDLPGVRAIQVEPRRWWLLDPAPAIDLGGRGAVTPFGGGLVCATIRGVGWRDLLSVSGVFDIGDSGFTTGSFASTVIHHVPVRIVATGANSCEVYCPASYAATLDDLWRGAIRGR